MATQESGFAEASPGPVYGAALGSLLARHKLAMVHSNFAKLACRDTQIEEILYTFFTIIYSLRCVGVRKNTFESILAFASEIILSALALSIVLARIVGAFIYVNLQS